MIKTHLVFVEVCKAYQRLCVENNKGNSRPEVQKINVKKTNNTKGLIKHSDPAYAYYKTATTYYSKIHPSQWNISSKKTLFETFGDADLENQKETQSKVIQLVSLFPKAYYYFSIVVNE